MRRTLLAIGLILVALIVAIWYFSSIFFYLTVSLVLATVLRPLTNKINKFDFFGIPTPRVIAVLVSFSVVIALIVAFITLFIPLVSHQIEIIAGLEYEGVFNDIFKPVRAVEEFMIRNELTSSESGFLMKSIHDSVFSFMERIDVADILNRLFSVAGSTFIALIAIVFITFFLLYENGIVRRLIISIIPNQYFEVFISALYKVEKLLSNYLLGLLFQMVSIFAMASIGLAIVGIDYAITIAVFAAVANLIPYMGPILGGIFGILVAVSTSGDFSFSNDTIFLIIKVFSVFATVQVIDNVVLQPLIFSKSVKAHPLEIFVIIFVGATIAGIPGMIAAIPVYTIIRVSSSEIYTGFTRYRIFKTKN